MNKQSIAGLVATGDGYAIKNFLSNSEPIFIGNIKFKTYKEAINALSGKIYPLSFQAYLEIAEDLNPTHQTWDNLIFTGHSEGIYDHEQKRFISAQEKGMESTTRVQEAYVEALHQTYQSIIKMIQ